MNNTSLPPPSAAGASGRSFNERRIPSGLLRKIAALMVTVALAALMLMFFAVFIAVILVAGFAAFIYLWWKTRELRKQMRNIRAHNEIMGDELSGGVMKEDVASKGVVIEGEAIRVADPGDRN